MEKELLTQMIADRDRRIATIRRKMEEQDKKMIKFKDELNEIKSRRETSEMDHMTELTTLMEEKEKSERVLGRLQQDLQKQQGDSLQLYAEVIKQDAEKTSGSATSAATDSSYVMRMQAQLCKCMHSMGIVENQMELVKATCDEMVKSLKEAVNRTVDEKTQVELQFMNELVMTDNKRRDVEEELQNKLNGLREEIEELEAKLEELESDDEDDSDSEIDEEEEEEKELLKKELRERNDEIASLEKEIEEQKIKIQQLESGVSNGEQAATNNNDEPPKEAAATTSEAEPEPDAAPDDADNGEEDQNEVST